MFHKSRGRRWSKTRICILIALKKWFILLLQEMCSLVGLFSEINQAHIKAAQCLKPYSCFVYFACRSESQDHRGQCGEVNLGKPATAVRNHQICHSSHFNSQRESDLWRPEWERKKDRQGRRRHKQRERRRENEINRVGSKGRGAERRRDREHEMKERGKINRQRRRGNDRKRRGGSKMADGVKDGAAIWMWELQRPCVACDVYNTCTIPVLASTKHTRGFTA